jgi:hypothetical protein
MKKSMYLTHEPTLQQVALLERGEITREQAAAALGISVGTLNSRLCRTKFNERLKGVRAKPTDAQAMHFFQSDPEKAKAYEAAVAVILSTPKSKVKALHAQKFPSLSYQILARKVKAARG